MNIIPKLSVKNSLLVNLISIFILILGYVSLTQMRREAFPQVDYDIVTVSAVYPGAPAEDVEKFITIPIEKELKSISGIEKMSSKSDEGVVSIALTIDPGVYDKDKVVDDIERAVDRVNDLPEGVEDPTVFELASREFPVIEIALSGDVPDELRRDYAESLRDGIKDVAGVSQVREYGWRDPEYWVEVDPQKMEEYYVSMQEVVEALRSRNVTIPGGQLTTHDNEYNIRTTGEFKTSEEIESVIIRANDSGHWLRVGDVADVRYSYEDATSLARINGQSALVMVAVKAEQADAIQVVNDINFMLDGFKSRLDDRLTIHVSNDLSFYIKRRLGVLKVNALVGFALVLVILFLFLDPIPAFMTALGIPIALFMAFWVMSMFNITINLVSMLGLILVLGMLVDDGIIVSENVYRYVEDGVPPQKAAILGTSEVMAPVTITILTTFAAFMPLLLMKDIMGKFVREIPMVVMITLSASLFEAFVILPSHLSDVLSRFHKTKKRDPKRGWYGKILQIYRRQLEFVMRCRYLFLGLLLVILTFSGFVAVTQLKLVLFGGQGIEFFWIRAEATKGTPLNTMRDKLMSVEKLVAAASDDEVKSFRTIVGSIESERGFDPSARLGSHLAQITVFLTPAQQRQRRAQDIADEFREKLQNTGGFENLYTFMPKEGPPTGPPIQVGIKGEDFSVMRDMARHFEDFLLTRQGVSDVAIGYDHGKKQLKILVDEEKARRFHLSIAQIANGVRNVFKGSVATSIKPDRAEEEIDVVVRFPEQYRQDLNVFQHILIRNARGQLVKLSAVADIKEEESIFRINHKDGLRVVYVTAQVDNVDATSFIVNQELQTKFADLEKQYPGYHVEFSGEFEDQMTTLFYLFRSYLFALFMIFILLVAMFRSLIQPFIVMSAIPFGVIGVILAFWVHDIVLPVEVYIDFFAMMGLVGLTGIVVNDSVVLVDFINRLRKKGLERRMSLIEAGCLRLRPVIMTSVTTIGGLISVAYGIGGSDPFLKPMALAIIWGLTFSTGLTLLGVPCFYAIFDDFMEHVLHRQMVEVEASANLDE